jgi:peptide/nickel transport system permease protein
MTIIIFVMLRLVPGSPSVAVLGEKATDEQIAAMDERLGLNEPIYVQYGIYIGDLVQLDLGESTKYNQPVNDILWERLRVSLSMVLMTAILTILISLPLGIYAALKKDSFLDNVVRSSLMVTMVMPTFYTGILLIIIFSVKFNLFPASGYGDTPIEHAKHLFLPGLALALGLCPILIRTLRTSILEAIQSDYVKTARSKGLAEQAVLSRHVLRNALIPIITSAGSYLPYVFLGSLVFESFFGIPGLGAFVIEAIAGQDFAIVRSMVFVGAVLYIASYIAIDFAYTWADPRVRLA